MKTKISNYLPLAAIAAGVFLAKKNGGVSGVGRCGVSGAFSPNAKLNAVLSEIYDQVATFKAENPIDFQNYVRQFPIVPDYNLAQYGNGEFYIYYDDVINMYRRAGYTSRMTGDQAWQTYLRQIGWVVRNYFLR